MARFFKKRIENKGQAPGSLVFIGSQRMDKPFVRLIQYDSNNLDETELNLDEDLKEKVVSNKVNWINIDGLHDIDYMKKIGNEFNLHSLLLEDLVSTAQRPKLEEFDDDIHVILKMLQFDSNTKKIVTEQFSMVLGKKYLLTFQEKEGDVFEPVRERIRKNKGRIRNVGNDYLAYAILDTIIDNYIFLLEEIGENIENIEDKILDNPDKVVLEEIYMFKREINFLAKVIRPVRDLTVRFKKSEMSIINESTYQFLSDLDGLITHTVETIDTYRNLLDDFLNIYHTTVSNKMNEIMKVLTIFAAIFIPLTFVAGIYGTNFEFIPELSYRYSYFFMWGFMIIASCVMIYIFKRKKWF
jgi:magnesium transporter